MTTNGKSETTIRLGKGPTLDEVKAALAEYAERISKKGANAIAETYGRADAKGTDWDSIKPKKFNRVLNTCRRVIEKADQEAEGAAFHKANVAAVDTIGKQITSLADKIKREADMEADAKQKGESFFAHLVEKLREVEPLAKAIGMKVKDVKDKYIGNRLGDTRFKLALRIARGKITHEQANEGERTKKAEQRAAAKSSAPAIEPPRATGNSPSEEAIDARKAEMARIADDELPIEEVLGELPPPVAEHVEPPRQLTADELSDDHLTAFKKACADHCPGMTEADLKVARKYFLGEKSGAEPWRPRLKRAA